MKLINFCCGGLMGDFIHSIAACKNICNKEEAKANLYISNGYLADPFRYGVEKAYEDTYGLIMAQGYINSYNILPDGFSEPIINLNSWRREVHETYNKTGGYNKCWTKLMAETFDYTIGEYKWFSVPPLKPNLINKVVIHRSQQRHNKAFGEYFERLTETPIFLTTNELEYDNFEYKDRAELLLVKTITEMAIAIKSSKLFIGNQSAPFAIACALDVNRVCELCPHDASPFYLDEKKYSRKIKFIQ